MSKVSGDGKGNGVIRFKRFVIHELIGVGGMAEIYRGSAEQPDGRTVPIVFKRVKREYAENETFVRMFLDEAKLSVRMKHPNIVEVFEYGKDGDINYLTMEYIDGLNLQDTHKRYERRNGTPLPWQAVTLVVREILKGLEYTHELADEDGQPLGLVHRDVNLDNVMISRQGNVKLLDFGIVKAREGVRLAETAVGVLKGKLSYVSPEQVGGMAASPRSDLFSVGIVFHELLTGQRLFLSDTDLATLMAVKSKPIPDPREIRGEIPKEVSAVVFKALERDVCKRYSSARKMLEDVNGLASMYNIRQEVLLYLMTEIMQDEKERGREQKERSRKKTLDAWMQTDAEQILDLDESDLDFTGRRTVSGVLETVQGTCEDVSNEDSARSKRTRKITADMWGGGECLEKNENKESANGGDTLIDVQLVQAEVSQEAALAMDENEKTVLDDGITAELREYDKTVVDDSIKAAVLGAEETVILEDYSGVSCRHPAEGFREKKKVTPYLLIGLSAAVITGLVVSGLLYLFGYI